ncbi:rhomboid family intramembrane serine protease [Protofrankia symbiont of Coriaria ruscifolia]|uniref:Rhomboid family protein n=1 Tax=Candidatus Protofrankia californiensis TaxID=1839754 RepID=A0A1C3P0L6_9ACTN|nr:rhomboid family intramembrane serine protease [Protofrankia symbiont of Coriaria ruscifolia]SBW23334.1 rhomboid family protein [Candidatus Protofrankia californiensis]
MVLPIHDINPLRRRPVVTWLLIAVNIAVFVLFEPIVTSVAGFTTATPQSVCEQQRFFDHWGAVPAEMLENRPSPEAPNGRSAGVDPQGRVLCELESPPSFTKSPVVSVLTSMFLHGSWLHLIGNMLFLGVFGNNVEDRMGRFLYLIFYLVCGYTAAYGFALFEGHSSTTLIGASGAVAGVLGAYLVIFPRARVIGLVTFLFFLPFWLPAWLVLGFWFVLQYIYFTGMGVAEGGSVAYGAHVVGFIFGALAVLPFVRELRAAGPARRHAPDHRWVRRTPWS